MCKFLVGFLSINLGILLSGCSSEPPKPVLPDGSHRVPVNRVPPTPAAFAPSAFPDTPAEGGGR
jgi:hypothetical protein